MMMMMVVVVIMPANFTDSSACLASYAAISSRRL